MVRSYTYFNPRDTVLLFATQRIVEYPKEERHIQILFSTDKHWICSYYNTNAIYIYDSFYHGFLHEDHVKFLSALHPYCFYENKPIYFKKVTKQPNIVDCGVYAIVFATALILGYDSSKRHFSKDQMRHHLLQMFSECIISPFPSDLKSQDLPNLNIISKTDTVTLNTNILNFVNNKFVMTTKQLIVSSKHPHPSLEKSQNLPNYSCYKQRNKNNII